MDRDKQDMSIRFFIPAYDAAMTRLISDALLGFYQGDPILRQVRQVRDYHTGPIRNVSGPNPLDQNMAPTQIISDISFADIRNSNIDAFIIFVDTLATKYVMEYSSRLFASIVEISSAVGNAIDASGADLSFDMLNDMLERIVIDFDDDDNPIMPSLVIHPKMQESLLSLKPTPQQEARWQAIIQHKREEFHAKKRTRRLS